MGTNPSSDGRRELITKKAYELFVKRGSKPGHEMDDWLEAEKIVDRELAGQQSSGSSSSRQEPTPSNRSAPSPTPIRATSSSSSSTSKVGGYKRVSG